MLESTRRCDAVIYDQLPVMSLESAFAYARQDAGTSIAFKRRLRLLQPVLEYVVTGSAELYARARPLSQEKLFWVEFLTSCLPMQLAGWRFDQLSSQHEEAVGTVLQCLEDIVRLDSSATEQVRNVQECEVVSSGYRLTYRTGDHLNAFPATRNIEPIP